MLNKILLSHLKDSLRFEGDILDLRIYNTQIFQTLISHRENKKVFGLETFSGLKIPTKNDKTHYNYNEVKEGQFRVTEVSCLHKLRDVDKNFYDIRTTTTQDYDKLFDSSQRWCFVYFDLKQYVPAKNALEYLWNSISHGGTIFIKHYDDKINTAQFKAVKEWITDHKDHLEISRQMMIDGIKQKFVSIKLYNPTFRKKSFVRKRDKVSIAMVLKTGGCYNYNYVNALVNGIKNNITIDHELICLTDNCTNLSNKIDRIVPLNNNYPTWWSKIELFRKNIFHTKRAMYIDLDTIITNNIDDIASYDGEFCALRDFYTLYSLGSGIMGWEVDKCHHIYDEFAKKSTSIINNYTRGDQEWIEEVKPSIEYYQDLFPNRIVSYKKHCTIHNKSSDIIPDTASIVCFHGIPRPHTVKHPDIIKHWNTRQ